MLAGSSRDRPGGAVPLPARRGTVSTIRTATDNRRSASVSQSVVALLAAELPLVLLIKEVPLRGTAARPHRAPRWGRPHGGARQQSRRADPTDPVSS